MSAHDFLVELGTEELPPKTLKNLGQAFLSGVEKGLKAAGLSYSSARIYAAPRRLAVLVEQLASQQPDRSVNLDGPPVQAAFNDAVRRAEVTTQEKMGKLSAGMPQIPGMKFPF